MDMDAQYTVKTLGPGDSLADAYAVRTAVFIDEQGFNPELEMDALDATAHHIVLYQGGRPVGTGRVFAGEGAGDWIIGRVAVLAECRGGVGRELMGRLEELAKSLGAVDAYLGAQCRVQGFYAKLGYRPYGEIYYDEFCPHIHMKKTL